MIWLIILHKIPPNLGGWGEPGITLGLKNFSLTDVESQSRIEVQNSVFQGKDLKQLSELQFFLESSFGWCQVSKTPCKNIMEILFQPQHYPYFETLTLIPIVFARRNPFFSSFIVIIISLCLYFVRPFVQFLSD